MKQPTATEIAQLICLKREEFGYWSLAQELGCSVRQARAIVEADMAMADDAMYVQVLNRGTQMLAEQLRTTADNLDAFVEEHF